MQRMEPSCLDVHPMVGAIYQDGEFVQRGAVVGLSVDRSEVVIAPVSGWVRLRPRQPGRDAGLRMELWPQPFEEAGTLVPSTPIGRG